MNTATLRSTLDEALLGLEAARDELRDLDAAIGDGDLGITVSEGARATRSALHTLPEEAGVSEVLRTCAKQFSAANPSTMSALVAGGLLASASALAGQSDLDRAGCVTLLETATATIQKRGKAQIGDKTIVDALHPTIEVLRQAGPDGHAALASMIEAAEQAVRDTAGLQSQRGRAAWVGERTRGHPDGGATAYLRLLQALERAMPRPMSESS